MIFSVGFILSCCSWSREGCHDDTQFLVFPICLSLVRDFFRCQLKGKKKKKTSRSKRQRESRRLRVYHHCSIEQCKKSYRCPLELKFPSGCLCWAKGILVKVLRHDANCKHWTETEVVSKRLIRQTYWYFSSISACHQSCSYQSVWNEEKSEDDTTEVTKGINRGC